MEHRQLSVESKKRINSWLTSNDGKMFMAAIRDMHDEHINTAQIVFTKLVSPSEQIVAQIHQATGIKEVIDFAEGISREVEANRKEEELKSKL